MRVPVIGLIRMMRHCKAEHYTMRAKIQYFEIFQIPEISRNILEKYDEFLDLDGSRTKIPKFRVEKICCVKT